MTYNNTAFEVYGDTIIGPPSKKRGKPNQDAYGTLITSAGSAVVVAADGAGSLDKSDIGSQLAVETVLGAINESNENEYSPDAILEYAVEKAREVLLQHEYAQELGCTLVVAMVTDSDYAISVTGDAFAIVCQNFQKSNNLVLVENPSISEYANITKLLTSKETDTTIYYSEEKPDAIAVSSDGLAHFTLDNTLDGKVPTQGFWKPVFTKAMESSLNVKSLLKYMESLERTDDDTTLAIAVRNKD